MQWSVIITCLNVAYCCLWVTAILALARSKGYVNDCDVIPASEPARNCL